MPQRQIAQTVGCSLPTVWATLKNRKARQYDAASTALSKAEVAARVRSIGDDPGHKPSDRLGAWKLYCLMKGYLTPEQASATQVNITLNARSIADLEAEYRQISGRDLTMPAAGEVRQYDAPLPIGEHRQQLPGTQLAEPPTPSTTADSKAAGSPQRERGEGEQVPPQILPGFSGD